PSQAGDIEQLRSRIGRLTTSGGIFRGRVFPFGEPALDSALPWNGLPAGSLHEVVGYAPAITGFLAAYLARVRPGRPILWITADQQAYAPGLAAFGLDHRRLTMAWARRSQDRLWAFEDALRLADFGAVIAEIDRLGLTD